MSGKGYFVVSGSIFGLVALAHLARAVYQAPVEVAGWAVPIWPSWGGLVVAGLLCVWAFRLLRQ
ncbi:MAG: hypothetical protein ABSF26_09565 [Thermoguttaceae bacterium]|jgi:hypothetical protein